jgi:hypothetical protein
MGASNGHSDSTISEELISQSVIHTGLQDDLCTFTDTFLSLLRNTQWGQMAQWHYCWHAGLRGLTPPLCFKCETAGNRGLSPINPINPWVESGPLAPRLTLRQVTNINLSTLLFGPGCAAAATLYCLGFALSGFNM